MIFKFARIATIMGLIMTVMAAQAQPQDAKSQGTKSRDATSQDTKSTDDAVQDWESEGNQPPDDRSEVEDIVRMVGKGQLRLGAAIDIAERHTKGRAVSASVAIDRDRIEVDGDAPDAGDDRRGKESKKGSDKNRNTNRANDSKDRGDDTRSDTTSRNTRSHNMANEAVVLSFEVVCVADGELVAVHIDGQTRKVTHTEIRTTLDVASNQQMSSDNRSDSGSDRRDDADDDDEDSDRDDERNEPTQKQAKDKPKDQSKSQPEEHPKDQPKDAPGLPQSRP